MNAEKRIINQINNNSLTEDSANFNTKLKSIIMQYDLDEIENEIMPIISNDKYDLNTRFSVYYAVFIFFRRFEFHTKLYRLVDSYTHCFSDKKFNSVVLSQYYKFKFIDTNDKHFAVNALTHSRDAISKFSSNPGVLHNYAELVASFLEADLQIESEDINSALRFIDHAIDINPNHPKQYATKGRLLSFIGDYEKAKTNIRKAIDYEDADGKDSLIRISQYNNYLIDIKTRESLELLKTHLNEADQRITEGKNSSEQMIEKMESMQSKYLELLAFFSGILSLIISVVIEIGGGGAKIEQFNQMVGVTLTLGGVLLLSFAGLRMMITYKTKDIGVIRIIGIFVISIIMIVLGYFIGNV